MNVGRTSLKGNILLGEALFAIGSAINSTLIAHLILTIPMISSLGVGMLSAGVILLNHKKLAVLLFGIAVFLFAL